jgi:hypothetical protein
VEVGKTMITEENTNKGTIIALNDVVPEVAETKVGQPSHNRYHRQALCAINQFKRGKLSKTDCLYCFNNTVHETACAVSYSG